VLILVGEVVAQGNIVGAPAALAELVAA